MRNFPLNSGAVLLFMTLLSNCTVSDDVFMDRLFRDYSGDVPGAAVMIIQDGCIRMLRTYGIADVEHRVPVQNNTDFRLASITKQFTAMAIMILKERGLLSYDNTLTDIFPDFPDYGKKITISHILHHQSGLVAYEDLIPDTATVQVLDKDILHMMMSLDSTYFEPGTEYRYSNTGYAVLAMVSEKVSGKSFAQFLQDEIFSPLGMNHTVAYEKGISEVPNRAFGYTVEGDSITYSDQSLTSAVLGDGGIYTSLEDMFIWDQSLYTDKLVSRESLQEAFTPSLEHYGYGWRIDTYKGHDRVYHAGSTCGFRNIFQRFPKDYFSVLILTNRAEPDPTALANKIVDRFLK